MTHNRIVEAVVDIAKTLNDGEEIKNTGNRMADALDSIADSYGGSIDNPSGNRIADALEAIAENIEGGGGNPNYVETIEATLETLFDAINVQDIIDGILNDSISVYGTQGSSYRLSALNEGNSGIKFMGASSFGSNKILILFRYNVTGELIESATYMLVTDGTWTSSAIPSTTPVVMTIIHHTLPESEVTP